MDSNSQNVLRRVEANDVESTDLKLGHSSNYFSISYFKSSNASDYARLGAAIGDNTHLKTLTFAIGDECALDISNTEFFNGLKRNSSINDLKISYNRYTLIGGVGHEILKTYQDNNNNLTCLCINSAVLDNGGGDVITETLRWCGYLKTINLEYNRITDEQLLPMIDAIRGHTSLEYLYLHSNRIGNAGCEALATLLEHTNFNLKVLDLETNQIGTEGATAIANSLANNTKLEGLDLQSNPFDPSAVGIFCTVLCNTSSVNDTYRSNHTLDMMFLSDEQRGQDVDHLATVLDLNKGTNKSHVAIKKILKYHPIIDMEPLFEWGVEEDGEQNLKALPFIIDWFERAEEAVAEKDNSDDDDDSSESDDDDDEEKEDYQIAERKLSAIFQFAKAMPLLLEGIARYGRNESGRSDNNKRKRTEG